jgi:hypothetical protein
LLFIDDQMSVELWAKMSILYQHRVQHSYVLNMQYSKVTTVIKVALFLIYIKETNYM